MPTGGSFSAGETKKRAIFAKELTFARKQNAATGSFGDFFRRQDPLFYADMLTPAEFQLWHSERTSLGNERQRQRTRSAFSALAKYSPFVVPNLVGAAYLVATSKGKAERQADQIGLGASVGKAAAGAVTLGAATGVIDGLAAGVSGIGIGAASSTIPRAATGAPIDPLAVGISVAESGATLAGGALASSVAPNTITPALPGLKAADLVAPAVKTVDSSVRAGLGEIGGQQAALAIGEAGASTLAKPVGRLAGAQLASAATNESGR